MFLGPSWIVCAGVVLVNGYALTPSGICCISQGSILVVLLS